MWILIDRERMVVTHRHENVETINNLAHIELAHNASVVMKDNHIDGFKTFSDYELKMLYTNLCGQKFDGYNMDALSRVVSAECNKLEESKVNELEVGIQAVRISGKDSGHYKYKPGSNDAEELEDLYKAPALVSVAGYIPAPTLNHVPKKPIPPTVTPVTGMNPYVVHDNSTRPTSERAQTRDTTISAPRTAGATKKVWEIADACFAEYPNIDKTLRGMVAKRCEEEGVNSSTMSVQFSKWKQTKI